MWLCWDGNRLFQQWVLPLSLCCSIDSFLLAGRDTAVQRLIQKHLIFFFFLCQLISHAIMRDAETSLGPTDYRAPGSSAAAGQNMTSPSTNAMKGQTPPRGGLSCGRCRAVARSLETEARASQYNRTPPAERFFKNPQPNSALHWLCSSKCFFSSGGALLRTWNDFKTFSGCRGSCVKSAIFELTISFYLSFVVWKRVKLSIGGVKHIFCVCMCFSYLVFCDDDSRRTGCGLLLSAHIELKLGT